MYFLWLKLSPTRRHGVVFIGELVKKIKIKEKSNKHLIRKQQAREEFHKLMKDRED